MSQGITRREALRGAVATAAVACGPGAEKKKAAAAEARIDHVIVVMMENRSFDHWYGARKLLEGEASDGLTADMSNPAPDGTEVVVHPIEEQCMIDPGHGWDASREQFNGGANDGFCQDYSGRSSDVSAVMGYETREDLPISWALADNFALCDRYFCSVMGPTWPNRLYGHLASSQGMQSNAFPEGGIFTDRSVWKALEEVGVSWGYYYSDIPFIGLLADHFDDEKVKLIEDFFKDVASGQLPAVVWVDPAFSYNDNHPPHHPALGELFLASLYEALAASGLWERCLVLITYDEHGGFFDHVPPPTIGDDRAAEGFDQLGFRVPAVAIGPWVKQGVDSTVYDHASWIRYVCEKHGIELWNERLRTTSSLAGVLDADRMARVEPLPAPELPAFTFDESTLEPECTSYAQALIDAARRQGYRVRIGDGRSMRALFKREWRRRGLIG